MGDNRICLYIKGTDKVYKMFDDERKANEFLNLHEMYHEEGIPSLELGECHKNTRILWSYPIHWEIINGIHLNNFEAYEHLLFMDDERKLPNRWEKFADVYYDGEYGPGIYMPFDKPRTCHEYHLNHFVYWMVIGHLGLTTKPTVFFDYNTGHKICDNPINFCWACSYDRVIGLKARERKGLNWYSCDCCPIWEKGNYQCENDDESPYGWWNYGFDRQENAIKLAKMPWRDLDEMVDHILY